MTETELRILSAAREVLLERGVDGARTEEIARRAGVNKALLHYYFGTKQNLCLGVLRQAARELFDRALAAIQPQLPFRQALEGFVNEYVDYVAKNHRLTRLVLWELGRGGQTLVDVFREIMREKGDRVNPLIVLFQRAVERGEIRPIDPVQAALSLIGACVFPFLARDVAPVLANVSDVLDAEFLAERKKHIVDLFCAGLRFGTNGPSSPEGQADERRPHES